MSFTIRVSVLCMMVLSLSISSTWAQEAQIVPLKDLPLVKGKFAQYIGAMFQGQKEPNAYHIPTGGIAEFTLNNKYDWFSCVVGMEDSSETNDKGYITIDVNGENQVIDTKVIALKPGIPIKVSLKGCLRLTLHAIDAPHGFIGYPTAKVIFINPCVVRGTPPEPVNNSATASSMTSPNQSTPATFVVDPNDLDKLAVALRKQVDAKPEIKAKVEKSQMAIMTFNLIDIPSQSVAANVAEDITTSLMKSDFQTVERGQLDKVLKELKVQDSGLINPSTAQKIGQVTGCNIIMVGSISDRGQFIVINARMLDTATGKTMSAERVECRKIEIKR